MVTVKFGANAMEAKGHAGYAAAGQDIVCAALSVLFYTAEALLWRMYAAGKLEKLPVTQLEPGEVLLSACPTEAGKEEARWIWQMLREGIGLVAESYQGYVVIQPAEAGE